MINNIVYRIPSDKKLGKMKLDDLVKLAELQDKKAVDIIKENDNEQAQECCDYYPTSTDTLRKMYIKVIKGEYKYNPLFDDAIEFDWTENDGR